MKVQWQVNREELDAMNAERLALGTVRRAFEHSEVTLNTQ